MKLSELIVLYSLGLMTIMFIGLVIFWLMYDVSGASVSWSMG